MLFYVSWHASEVKFTVVFSSICVIRWPSVRNLYSDPDFFFQVFAKNNLIKNIFKKKKV